jgi:DNA-directed RNA polymerase specialized sigma24 family protein
MTWRLPQHCYEALLMAAKNLRLSPGSFWADDIMQAGRIALWQRAEKLAEPGSKWLAYTVARSAMIDELRRLTPWHRLRVEPEFVDWEIALAREEAPERADDRLPALEMLKAMEEMAPGWAEALALSENLAAAGRRMGRTESRACQVRHWLQVSFA